MTSAPVKDVNSLMNFVGGKNFTKTGGANQAGGFGDIMNMARNNGSHSQNQVAANQGKSKVSSKDAMNSRRDTVKPQETVKETARPEEMTAEQEKALEEAGAEVIKEIAGELGVSQEDVEKAMEELGLSVYSLFDSSNMTQLVLKLSGEQDMTALLTDENLFASLQNLIGAAKEIQAGLAQEMGVDPEDMQALLAEAQSRLNGQTVNENAATENEAKEAPQITVEVKAGDETVKLAADERGNVAKTVDVVPTETEKNVADDHAEGREQKGSENGRGQSEDIHTGNLLLDALSQDKMQTAGVSFEQAAAPFSEQTMDIMDQIMDYMKIQLKPGMDQLEMQLHPASLGTVHIQLSSKGGEVTALFQVQNETVKAAIESQVATLQETLKEQGVKVEAVQVTVENHGFESNLWQGQGREENASSQGGRKSPRRININELDGAFEEEASEEEVLAARMMEANGNTVDYTA